MIVLFPIISHQVKHKRLLDTSCVSRYPRVVLRYGYAIAFRPNHCISDLRGASTSAAEELANHGIFGPDVVPTKSIRQTPTVAHATRLCMYV